jgi:putative molybdopterin biosynthesis protein
MNTVLKTAQTDHASNLISAIRRAARQEQFLEVVSAEEAYSRFTSRIDMSPGVQHERVSLSLALGRVLAQDVIASTDVPPFDRANVDGFALRSADTFGASDIAPRRLRLNGEVIVCGHAPTLQVEPDAATTIATGGVIPRGANAVVMVEQTEVIDQDGAPAIELRRPAGPGQFISYAGSDIARGEVVLRRKTVISSREIGMLAACGIAEVAVVQKPKVAVLSTGNELVAPGGALGPARVYDSNGPILAAAIAEAGGEPIPFGAFPDDESALEAALRTALELAIWLSSPAEHQKAPAIFLMGSSQDLAIRGFLSMASRLSRASRSVSPSSKASRLRCCRASRPPRYSHFTLSLRLSSARARVCPRKRHM